MVNLEGDPAAVVVVEVGLDRDPLLAPEEIDGPAPHLDVDLRGGKFVAAAQMQEVPLEVAARPVGFDLPPQRQLLELRLANCPPPLPTGDRSLQVGDGSGR